MKQTVCLLGLFALTLVPFRSVSQLFVDNNVNATDGVENVLLGNGVVVSGITFLGALEQIGSFTCSGCNLGIGDGLVMGSGNINEAPGPNSSGSVSLGPSSGWGFSDPDLAELSGFALNDAAVLEFDFVPTGDSLVFQYVFGSDEYPEFSNSSFNDAFGFFISGPGIAGNFSNGAINIALIPGTNLPVTINNVNNGGAGTGPCEYCEYYIHNGNGGGNNNSNIECDGFTTVLTAYANVQCGETYHIKLAIADAGDTGYDSFVFLEAGSFSSNQVQLTFTPPSISPDQNSLYEGCLQSTLEFERPASQAGEATYEVIVTGTAQNGVDYTFIPDTLYFAQGQLNVAINVEAWIDDIPEGSENITITVMGLSVCSLADDSATFTFSIQDIPDLEVSIPDVLINCGEVAVLEPQISGGFGYYEIVWETGDDDFVLQMSPLDPVSYSFTITDTCNVEPFEGIANIVFPPYDPISVDIGNDLILSCLNPLNVSSIVSGGYGAYAYSWEVNGVFVSDQNSINYTTDDAGDVTLTITDVCNEEGFDELAFSFPTVPVIVDLGPDFDVTCLDVTTLSAQVSGGIGAYTYSWTSSEENYGSNTTSVVQIDEETTITLTIEDQCENIGTDVLILDVPPVPLSVDLGSDLVVTCIDDNLITPLIVGGVGNFTYSWSTQNGVESLNPTYLLQTDEDITLAIDIVDQCGNIASDAIEVAVPQVAITLDLGNNLEVGCVDITPMNPNAIGGVGNFQYTWTIDGEVVSFNENFNLQVSNDSYLGLTIEDECGNFIYDEIEISVPPVPVIVDLGPDLVVTCLEESILIPSINGGVGTYSYQWVYQDLLIGNESNQEFQTMQNATVQIIVEDECGNSNYDEILISVPPVPLYVSLNTADTAICIGESINLEVFSAGGVGEYTYQWTPDFASLETLNNSPQESTTYSVVVEDECGNQSQTSVFVGVENVSPGFMVEYIGDFGVQLYNQSDYGISYIWYFNDGSSSEDENPYHTFQNMEPWQVTLEVTGELGCQKSITEIFYPIGNIFVPNCFTPDGDGVNEVFQVYGHDILNFEIVIFSRWGEMVYRSTDMNEAWTGGKNGSEHFVSDGIYSFMLKAEGIRGNFIEKSGQVTLLR
ncbi:MAG: choice-of-anchor L domain-containing protein [Flavobacteriales bacterium]|nr:choice-of-anchor L domain-containing protein [Flavobacteriales bacterium]